MKNNIEITEILLKYKININIKNNKNQTALHIGNI